MKWWIRVIRAVSAVAIGLVALYVAQTMQTPPELPRGLLTGALLLGAFVVAWLADDLFRKPRKRDRP